ncbi:MAG: YihY/virulence factor BrkB family protein [Caldisericia bacterium]|nr:YihY/virulence factor BrkB family protein [Caldisericia bacterium]
MKNINFCIKKTSYIFRTSIVNFFKDGCLIKAAGLSWILFLTIIPIVILIISIAGRILPAGESIVRFTDLFFNFVDQFSPTQISSFQSVIDNAFKSSYTSSIVALLVMLWSLFVFYSWIESIFSIIWRVRIKQRNFLLNKLRGFGIMFLMILFLVFSLFVYNTLQLLIQFVDTSTILKLPQQTSRIILYVLNLVLAGFAFFTFFKWISPKKVNTKAAFFSALLSLSIELFALFFYQIYLEYFSKASFIYGSMFSIIIIFVWMDYTMITLLFGCEFCKTLHQSIN